MIRSNRSTCGALVFAAIAAVGCQSKPAPAPQVSPDVWAVVDGREIHRDAVEKAYRRTVQPNPAMSDEEALAAKLNVLDQVIIEDLMLASARDLKVEVTDAELDTAFNEGRKDMPEDAFNKELAGRNLTVADMREGLRRDLTVQKILEREVSSKITVTDQDVDQFFQANKAQFNLTEDAYHLAQIVVTAATDPGVNNRTGDDAGTGQAATAKVQMLMDRLKSGTPFNELAMDYSEDPESTPRGGDMGLVPVSALRQAPPPLRDAAMKSQPGTVNVVTLNGGYTILGVLAKQAAGQRDPGMPDIRNGIMDTLRGRREQVLRTAYIQTLRNKAGVVNHLAQRLVESQGKVPPALGLTPPR